MQYALIHTATRVIRRITTEDTHQVLPDETSVPLAQEIDLGAVDTTRFWKLDANNLKVPATVEEARAAKIDEDYIRVERARLLGEMKAAIKDFATNGVTLTKLRAYFTRLDNLNDL